MTSPRTLLRNLKNLTQYLRGFPQSQQPAAFEYLISQTFGHILGLPFYTVGNDNPTVTHRVVWNGNYSNMSKSPPGPDSTAYAYEFCILIEATLRTGSSQWGQEFSACVRHRDDFIRQNQRQAKDVYVILVAPKIHEDTYRSIRRNPRNEHNFIILETANLSKILETSILTCTMRHLELRKLFSEFQDFLQPSSVRDFLKNFNVGINSWQKKVLNIEKNCFLGIRSYEAIKQLGRNNVATTEILRRLQRNPVVNHYVKIINEKVTLQSISDSLNMEKLAYNVGKLADGEDIFCPVPVIEFRGRINRIVTLVENI